MAISHIFGSHTLSLTIGHVSESNSGFDFKSDSDFAMQIRRHNLRVFAHYPYRCRDLESWNS